jgi:uncharacterized membrane protein
MKRIPSIDIARGLVMVIMALDHTRDMLHADALTQSPTDMATTTPILFFTRWITHLCAPSFVFLSGVSAYISMRNGQDPRTSRRFLLSRGIWLLVLEFTLVNFAIWFDVHFKVLIFEVIAAIGSGFIALSFLSRFSPRTLLIIGLIIIVGHDSISFFPMPAGTAFQFAGSLLFGPGAFPLSPNFLFVVGYPILPWLGIMLTGFAAGRLFERPAADRKKLFRRKGLAALGAFLLLRAANIYGDPAHWTVQTRPFFTILSFLNVSKYPPSLLFTLCMLGILLLILSGLEGRTNGANTIGSRRSAAEAGANAAAGPNTLTNGRSGAAARILSVYGKTPLFYFLLHLYIIHSFMLLLILLQGYHLSDLSFAAFRQGRPSPKWGLSLGYIYPIWIGVVALLFPVCRWYGRYKLAHRDKKWLRYL